VTGRYHETKAKDTSLLGGGKPAISLASRPANGWKVDEQDMGGTSALMPAIGKMKAIASRVEESRGEFRRSAAARREGSADFGSVTAIDEAESPPSNRRDNASIGAHPQAFHFPDDFASSDDDDSDDDEGGWLASSTFGTGHGSPRQPNPETSSRIGLDDASDVDRQNGTRRPLSEGFEDTFDPMGTFGASIDDPFAGDDDDGFGPFSDAAASDESALFDTFGDFGEFQSGSGSTGSISGDASGELTPTGDSWTFASASSSGTSTSDDLSEGDIRTVNVSDSSP